MNDKCCICGLYMLKLNFVVKLKLTVFRWKSSI